MPLGQVVYVLIPRAVYRVIWAHMGPKSCLVPPGLFWAFGGTLTNFEREYLVSVMAELHEVECHTCPSLEG